MRALRDMPLRRKLTAIIMLTSTATLVLAVVGFVANDIATMRRAIAEDLVTLADITAANSAAAVLFGDRQAVEETLGFLHSQPQVVAAAIYGRDGEPLGSYRRADAGAASPGSAVVPGTSPDHIALTRDISLDGQRIGSIYMRSDLSKLRKRLVWYGAIALAVLISSLIVAFGLSAGLQRVVTVPILTLAGTARRVSSAKDYSVRACRHGSDEIGELIDSFNHMLAEIQSRDTELENHRGHLQEMVSLRTAELEAVNAKLHIAKEKAEDVAERMAYQAYHDALTGLPNRALLNDRLIVALAHALRERHKLALLFLDLDRFKVINDSLGHAIGDRLLVHVARRLLQCVRADDTVARLGGDEFMILLVGIRSAEDAGRIAQKVIEALAEPVECDGQELHITTSIGISVYPDDGRDSGMLMKHADMSMYQAKERGRNNYEFWSADMDEISHRRLTLENQLRKAIEREELVVYYQPKVNLRSGAVIGAEALVRWQHPELGLMAPGQFIALAEETGLIVPIGEWVLRAACRQARSWEQAGHGALDIAVNLSAWQFRKNDMAQVAAAVLDDTGLDARRLELEITESVLMQSTEGTLAALYALKRMGVRIAIDDFGTGYSSLSYLRRFPVDTVKIDRTFVAKLPGEEEDVSIVTAIIAMARSLRLHVVAEGVEDEAQMRFLREHRCDCAQGYLFSPPVDEARFAALAGRRFGAGSSPPRRRG